MNQTTDQSGGANTRPESELTRGAVISLICITVLTFGLYAFVGQLFPEGRYGFAGRSAYAPYTTAASETISQGLQQFSTGKADPIIETNRWYALYGLLLFYVFIPATFLFSWRLRSIASIATSPHARIDTAHIFMVVSGVVATFLVIVSSVGAVRQAQVFSNMKGFQEVQRNRDRMIQEINDIAVDAYQYRILPRTHGGGQGSYADYDPAEALRQTDAASYTLEGTDWTLKIRGVSKIIGDASITASIGPDGSLAMWESVGAFR